ncbi:MAG: enoyl-CoA hydratase/isomerase family protein [Chloroflexia bacterium]|nr:enoyl-CoA hydratase/isomerase family protein [Chloroflexia bacterium]
MAVHVERDGAVAIVTMSRPEAMNAFNTEQLQALLDRVRELSSDSTVRAVVLTGEGKRAFAAGADISEMSSKGPAEARRFGELGHAIGRGIGSAPQPWIAAVNGYALGGGCEMALACDIRVASENAQLGQPEVTLGIPAGWGGTQRLPRLVGPGIAAEMLLTGRRLKADEALRIGLVNAVYPSDELLPNATEMAQTIANNSPAAVTATKQAMRLAFDVPLADGLTFEAQIFALAFDTQDQKEGMTAFAEKRSAKFSGE